MYYSSLHWKHIVLMYKGEKWFSHSQRMFYKQEEDGSVKESRPNDLLGSHK